MAKKVLFRKPSGIIRNGKGEYRALVIGVWVYGPYKEVNNMYLQGKADYKKSKTKGNK